MIRFIKINHRLRTLYNSKKLQINYYIAEFGFWGGFDTYEGALAGVQIGDRDLFGYGRPLTATIEVSQRSYRGEILYEDPFFLDTDFVFTARAFALTFDYDGYTKFELGGRFELSRKITKYDEASLTFSADIPSPPKVPCSSL